MRTRSPTGFGRGRLLAATITLLGLCANAVAADGLALPPEGARVRVAVARRHLVGTLVALDDATITLDLGSLNGTTRVPRDAITAVEVSRRRGRKRKGALLGALVGLGIAATLGAMNGESCEYPPIESRPGGLSVPYDGDCFGPAQVAGILSMLTVPVGALVGFAVSPGEEWEGVSPPGPWRVTVAPVRGGGLRAAFVLGF